MIMSKLSHFDATLVFLGSVQVGVVETITTRAVTITRARRSARTRESVFTIRSRKTVGEDEPVAMRRKECLGRPF
jgi:ferredoxin-fold anticodon binding domain-containing protein